MKKLLIALLVLTATAFAQGTGGGQSGSASGGGTLTGLTVQNNGTSQGTVSTGGVVLNLISGCSSAALSGTVFGITCTGGDTITSPNSTLTVGGTVSATTLDLNLGNPNIWTGAQTFGTITPTTVSGAVNFSGTPTFAAGAGLGTGTYSGNATFSGNDTFSNATGISVTNTATVGTLAATTISGAALSGTFTGAPTLSGNVAFTGTPTFSNPLALGSSTATTQSANANNTTLATTAYVGNEFATPPTAGYGSTTPEPVAATTLSASSTVSGTGFSTYLASPPAIGGTAAAAGNFTTLGLTGLETLPVGTTSAPNVQATGSASNTGILITTAAMGWVAAGTLGSASVTGGFEVANTKALAFSQTNGATGAAGPSIGVVGTGATENMNPTSILLQSGQCKPATAITLTTQTTICSWTLPNSAQTWSWQCQGTYSTSTTAISFTLGMVAAQAPTSETGNGIIYTGLAGTSTAGSATATTTTATTILAGGSVSTATASIPWMSSGTIQASATSGTFILYGTASTSGDVTVNVGTTCHIY